MPSTAKHQTTIHSSNSTDFSTALTSTGSSADSTSTGFSAEVSSYKSTERTSAQSEMETVTATATAMEMATASKRAKFDSFLWLQNQLEETRSSAHRLVLNRFRRSSAERFDK